MLKPANILIAFALVVLIALPALAVNCNYCRRPLSASYITFEQERYHRDCYEQHVASRCDFCSKIIDGEYRSTFWGEKYHARHFDEATQCDYCRRLIGDKHNKGGREYKDGRMVCNICLKTAIEKDTPARHLFDEVRQRLRRFGVDIDYDEIPLQLVDRNTIGRHLGGENGNQYGYSKYSAFRLGDQITQQQVEVNILRGLPRTDFISTAAHELMHVWIYLNGPPDMKDALTEGSCNYASFMVMKQLGTTEAEYVMYSMQEDPHPHYGQGYRRVVHLVNDRGLTAWLTWLTSNRDFPRGY